MIGPRLEHLLDPRTDGPLTALHDEGIDEAVARREGDLGLREPHAQHVAAIVRLAEVMLHDRPSGLMRVGTCTEDGGLRDDELGTGRATRGSGSIVKDPPSVPGSRS